MALRDARTERGKIWSQTFLGDQVGVNQTTVSAWERGDKAPTRGKVEELERVLGPGVCPPGRLVNLLFGPPPAPTEAEEVQAPMSFSGSAGRIWKLTRAANPILRYAVLVPIAVVLVALAWVVIAGWYGLFGLLLVPYRLVRRGGRQRKREALRHDEVLRAVERQQRRP